METTSWERNRWKGGKGGRGRERGKERDRQTSTNQRGTHPHIHERHASIVSPDWTMRSRHTLNKCQGKVKKINNDNYNNKTTKATA